MQTDNTSSREHGIGKILYGFYTRFTYFLPILVSNYKFRHSLLLPLYKEKAEVVHYKDENKKVIYMVINESTFSGGLSDRFRAIVSVYQECKRQGLDFYINFETPSLIDYLQPNEYDWRITEDEICYDPKECYPCTILTYHTNIKDPYQRFVQRTFLRYFLKKRYRQIHVYSNMVTSDAVYGKLFKELFRPTDDLQKLVDYHLKQIGGRNNYISCTFRFRQLLGDFKEGGEILLKEEKEKYIQRCLVTVAHLHEQYPDERILITSDSNTFLERVSTLDNIYVIPGKVVHIGFTYNADRQVYMKSFVDYYMLSYARIVFLVRDKLMYHSGFPYRAALLNDAEYLEIMLSQ